MFRRRAYFGIRCSAETSGPSDTFRVSNSKMNVSDLVLNPSDLKDINAYQLFTCIDGGIYIYLLIALQFNPIISISLSIANHLALVLDLLDPRRTSSRKNEVRNRDV